MKGIYRIKNLINNKVYIGQSNDLTNRNRNHFYWLGRNEHHNEHLQKSYNKYGKENFIFEVLEETENLNERELFWLNENGGLNSVLNYNLKNPLTNGWSEYVRIGHTKTMTGENNPNYGNSWNQEQKDNLSKQKKGLTLEDVLGKEKADKVKLKMSKSQKGRKHPEDVKEKIRQANIGDKNPAYGKGDRQVGENNPFYGKTHSDNVRLKLSEINKGKIVSMETKLKMSESAKNRKQSKEIKEKGKSPNINSKKHSNYHSEETKEKIRQSNIGEKNPAYGKGDRQKGDKNPNYGKPMPTRRPIQQLTKEGELIREFEYLNQVRDILGYNPSNVMYCANKKSRSSYGFIWKWKE